MRIRMHLCIRRFTLSISLLLESKIRRIALLDTAAVANNRSKRRGMIKAREGEQTPVEKLIARSSSILFTYA